MLTKLHSDSVFSFRQIAKDFTMLICTVCLLLLLLLLLLFKAFSIIGKVVLVCEL